MSINWKSRIVESGTIKAGQVAPNPFNFRVHSMFQQTALKDALERVGYIRNILINRRTGNLIDGHLRVMLALSESEEIELGVDYVDLSEDEERLALATLDPLAGLAATDKAMFAELVAGIETDSEALEQLFKSLSETKEEIPPEDFENIDEEMETDFRCP